MVINYFIMKGKLRKLIIILSEKFQIFYCEKYPPIPVVNFFPKDVVKTETNFPFDYLIKSELHLIIEKMYFLKKEKKFLTENRLDNKNG